MKAECEKKALWWSAFSPKVEARNARADCAGLKSTGSFDPAISSSSATGTAFAPAKLDLRQAGKGIVGKDVFGTGQSLDQAFCGGGDRG